MVHVRDWGATGHRPSCRLSQSRVRASSKGSEAQVRAFDARKCLPAAGCEPCHMSQSLGRNRTSDGRVSGTSFSLFPRKTLRYTGVSEHRKLVHRSTGLPRSTSFCTKASRISKSLPAKLSSKPCIEYILLIIIIPNQNTIFLRYLLSNGLPIMGIPRS